jgi:hypothetical protein
MTRVDFTFNQAKRIAKEAGFLGEWRQQATHRWKLPVTEGAGLEWSPTRSRLSAYGPDEVREELQAAIEKALQRNLIAPSEHQEARNADMEVVKTAKDLLEWVIAHMAAGETDEYPQSLVEAAEETIATIQDAGGRLPHFVMWSEPPLLGNHFAEMTSTCRTKRYSRMLMAWAGEMYDYLTFDDLLPEDALWSAIEAADLEDYFRKKTKGTQTWLVSRQSLEARFGVRVRVNTRGW